MNINDFMFLWLQDRYAFARTVPSLDASQDWELQGAIEEGGFTTLQFERVLDTCDEDDLSINFVSINYGLCAFTVAQNV